MAGVIPVIFASSLLYLPALLVAVQPADTDAGWAAWISDYLVARRPPALHARATSC